MMKFRAPMFGDRADAFYNAGGMLNSLRDVHDFCISLPSSRTPGVLVLGVDLWWLNGHVPPVFSFEAEIAKSAAMTFDEHIVGLRWLLRRPRLFARQAMSLLRGTQKTAIGISARESGGGFRTDGSFKSPLNTTPHREGMGIRRPGDAADCRAREERERQFSARPRCLT